MSKEAMHLALEALEYASTGNRRTEVIAPAVTALRQAIEQAEQAQPVAYIRVSKTGVVIACAATGDFYKLPNKTLLYTSPPKQEPIECICGVCKLGNYNLELPEPRLTGTFSIRAGKFKCSGCTGSWTNKEDAKQHSCKDYQ